MLNLRLFTIRLGSYTFSPKLIPTVVTLLLLYLLFSLGQWQLSRAQFKERIKQQIDTRQQLKPVSLSLLPDAEIERQFVPVEIRGKFNPDKSFLLDNKVQEMQAGFEVVTPFKTENNGWVLVNRGWLPQTRSRQIAPEFQTSDEFITLTGFVRTPSDNVFMLQDQQYDLRQWPVIIQSINIDELSKVLNSELLPFVVMLDQNSAGGFNRNWPAFKLDSEKNIGYAVQWFALFSALLGIYFIVNTKRKNDDE